MPQPNTLGRFLRYFNDAWRYAVPSQSAVKVSGMWGGVLDAMAQQDSWTGQETLDTDAAYRLAATSYAVYSAIKLIGDRTTAADARFEVKQRMGDGELEDEGDHPFERLLRVPNTIMAGSWLMRYSLWWYLLRGNAFVFLSTAGPGRGDIQELWPLPANAVAPLPDSLRNGQGAFRGQQVIDYAYTVQGKIHTLPGENVIHFRTPNPFDYWNGLSPLTSALVTLEMDNAQAAWVRDFFAKKNAIPSAILSVPAETQQHTFEAIREQLRQQFESGQKTLITRAGDLSVEVIQQTLEQMQVLATREFNAKAVDRIYGIPEGLITGGLSGDSRLAAEIALARNTVQPLLDYFAEELSAAVAPFYGPDIVIEAPNIVPQDRALEVQEYSIYGQDKTINENRAGLGLAPLDNELAEAVPVRLLQWVAPNYATIDGEEPESAPVPPQLQQFAAEPEEPREPGGMEATATPEQQTEAMAGKSTNGHDPALSLALAGELKRWRKVATREAKAGRNPAERPFESEIVPAELAAELRTILDGADEAQVKAAFDGMDTSEAEPLDELSIMQAVAQEYRRAADALAAVTRPSDAAE